MPEGHAKCFFLQIIRVFEAASVVPARVSVDVILRVVADDVALALVAFPVAQQRWLVLGIPDPVHILPKLFGRARLAPYPDLGHFALQGPPGVVGVAHRERPVVGLAAQRTHGQIDPVVGARGLDAYPRRFALKLTVDVDPHGARRLVVGAGHVVPPARLQLLGRVARGELAESRTAARAVELKLLALETRVADTQQQIALDAHDRGNVARPETVLRVELVDIDQRFVGHGRQSVPCLARLVGLVELRETDAHVGELHRNGDIRRTFHHVIGHVRPVHRRNRRRSDANRHQIGRVDGQRTRLLLARARQPLQMERNGLRRDDTARRNRNLRVLQLEIPAVEQRPLRAVAAVVLRNKPLGHLRRNRYVRRSRIGQRRVNRIVDLGHAVAERHLLHRIGLRYVEIDDVIEFPIALRELVAACRYSQQRNEEGISKNFFHGFH